jgi:MFS family permease
MLTAFHHWFDRNILELGREMRLSYLPPLMVYLAYGVSGLTSIVGAFFVKEYLGLSAAFLAALGFWAGIPWALKMPIGHLVDLIWRWKGALVWLGASLIAASLSIMVGLIGHREAMTAWLPAETWYVIAALLAPLGYVIQDVVADAMTVEAVPRVDDQGRPIDPERLKLMHTTMQTLGRVAIIGGGIFVALINLYVFSGMQGRPQAELAALYRDVYLIALAIPFISVLGVLFAALLKRRDRQRLMAQGMAHNEAERLLADHVEKTEPNWWILGGSLVFVIFTVSVGLSKVEYAQEIVFAGSLAIVVFLMARLTRVLDPAARATLLGTAIVIFAFRAVPSPGPGMTWWMIDELKFDQHFMSVLSLIGSSLALLGMFLFRRFMSERSITYVVGFLTLIGFLLALPILGMVHGLHEWTAAATGGMVDARFIVLVDTALESPLGQVAMIPMLAWIANSAPAHLKATFFAVMASFTNLALSAASLGTKYLNQYWVIERQVLDPATHAVVKPADYAAMPELLAFQIGLALLLPVAAIMFVRLARIRVA